MEGETVSHGGAGFPGNVHGPFGNFLFGRDDVFKLASHGPVADDQVGLRAAAKFVYDFSETDILSLIVRIHPAAVQPEAVYFAVAGSQLFDLPVGIGYEAFPHFRVLLNGIVHVAGGRRSECSVPVVVAVPVGLGEINGNRHAPFAEFVVQAAGDVRIGAGVERTGWIGDLIIGGLRVEHAETVMMLGGEQQIFESAFLRKFGPSVRAEADGIEGLVGVDILLLEGFDIRPVHIRLGPGAVPVGQRPGFQRAELAAGSPVHHEAEFEAHEPVQMFLNRFFFGRNIAFLFRVAVYTVLNHFFFHVFSLSCFQFTGGFPDSCWVSMSELPCSVIRAVRLPSASFR